MTRLSITVFPAVSDEPFYAVQIPLSGKDYQHRKQWMVERLTHLAQVFAIEIYAYSLMDNHSHLVLKINNPLSST